MSLLKAYFPASPEAEQSALLERLLSSDRAKRVLQTTALMDVLQSMDGPEAREYEDLKQHLQEQAREEIILKRLGCTVKATVQFRTPAVLKNLKPHAQGCVLNFQFATSAFQGYYRRKLSAEQLANPRIKKNWTTSVTFGAKRSQFAALKMVVSFLWKKHREAGGDACLH